jgi:hypothetical protein
MTRFFLGALLLGVLFCPIAAHAAPGCSGQGSGPCQNDGWEFDVVSNCSTVDSCFAYGTSSGITATRCVAPWGCPWCDANMDLTRSICTRHQDGYGWCSCTSPQPIQNGGRPRCTLAGTCNVR